MSIYNNRKVVDNNLDFYEPLRDDRGIKVARQFVMAELRYPTPEEISTLTLISYRWTAQDSLAKVSNKFYKEYRYGKIIAFFNKKPTEADIKEGDIIIIPSPLEKVKKMMRM